MQSIRIIVAGLTRTSAALLAAALLMPAPVALGAPAAQIPSCVVGDWRVDDVDGTFRAIFDSIPSFQLDSVTGDVLLSIRGDSSYDVRYDGLTLNSTTPSGDVSLTMDGTLRGFIRESQPGALVSSVTESTLAMTTALAGSTTTLPVPAGDADQDIPVDYDCGIGRLTFSSAAGDAIGGYSLNFVRR